MALSVNTNVGALNALASASSTNKALETSMARLASGKRINTAADDAAGSAIVSRLTSEIKGTSMAIRNASDAQSLINTAEGAHTEITNILQRMRELAVQGASDTNNTADRTNIASELASLSSELDRIGSVTAWAGKTLLNGDSTVTGAIATTADSTKTFNFQIGSGVTTSDKMTIAISAMDTKSLGLAANPAGVAAIVATSVATNIAAVTGYASGTTTVADTNSTLTDVGFTLGTASAGDTLNFTLDGKSFTATVGADHAATATAIQTAANAALTGSVIVTQSGGAYVISDDGATDSTGTDNRNLVTGAALTVTQAAKTTITTNVAAPGATLAANSASVSSTGTSNAVKLTDAVFTIGTATAGDTLRFAFNGGTISALVGASHTATAANIKTAWDAFDVTAGTPATGDKEVYATAAGVFHVVSAASQDITSSVLSIPATVNAGTTTVSSAIATSTVSDIKVTLTDPSEGDTLSFVAGGASFDVTVGASNVATATAINAAFTSALSGSFTTTQVGGVFNISSDSNLDLATNASLAVANRAALSASAAGTTTLTMGSASTASSAAFSAITATVANYSAGDTIGVSVNGYAISATTVTDLATSAAALVTAFNTAKADTTSGGGATLLADYTAASLNGVVTFTNNAAYSTATNMDVTTNTTATATVALLDTALTDIASARANLGAFSNRLDHTISNLTNVVSNLEAGKGRVEDADFAAESSNMAKQQILSQAATAMLAQANTSKQGLLQLLQR